MITSLEKEILLSVEKCIKTKNFSKYYGYFNDELINEFAKIYFGKFILPVSNGTVALDLILQVIELNNSDEVIMLEYDYISNYNILKYYTKNIKFCKLNKDTFCIDIKNLFDNLVTKNTKVLLISYHTLALHEIDIIQEFCNSKNIILIEDCCQSIGSKFNNTLLGSFGDFSYFSFGGVKTITSGQGGLIISKKNEDYNKLYFQVNRGKYRNTSDNFKIRASNYQLSEIQAAIILPQIKQLNLISDTVNTNIRFFDKNISNTINIKSVIVESRKDIICFMNFPIFTKNKNKFEEYLSIEKIPFTKSYTIFTKNRNFFGNITYLHKNILFEDKIVVKKIANIINNYID